MNKSASAANNTDMLSNIAKPTQEAQDESNRYSEKNRRPRQSRHTEGDSQNNANPGGDPSLKTLTRDIQFCFGIRDIAARVYISP